MNNPYHPYMSAELWQQMQPQQAMNPGYAYPQPPMVPAANTDNSTSRFVKGALVGAAIAYILTNEKVQQGAIKGAVKAWTLMQGGVEEMKERFRDAEAELHAAQMQDE